MRYFLSVFFLFIGEKNLFRISCRRRVHGDWDAIVNDLSLSMERVITFAENVWSAFLFVTWSSHHFFRRILRFWSKVDVGLDEIFVHGLLPIHPVSTDFNWKSRVEVSRLSSIAPTLGRTNIRSFGKPSIRSWYYFSFWYFRCAPANQTIFPECRIDSGNFRWLVHFRWHYLECYRARGFPFLG